MGVRQPRCSAHAPASPARSMGPCPYSRGSLIPSMAPTHTLSTEALRFQKAALSLRSGYTRRMALRSWSMGPVCVHATWMAAAAGA